MPQASAKTTEDPSLLTAELFRRIGFAVLGIAVPATASFSRRIIFILLPFGAALILLAALLAPTNGGGGRFRRAVTSPTGVALLVLAAWSTLSLLWAPYPGDAAQRLFKLSATLLLTAAGIVNLPQRMRISSIYLLPIGLALSTIIVFGMGVIGPRNTAPSESDAFTVERAGITLALLVWPALAALVTRRRWSSAGALAVGVAAAAAAGSTLLLLCICIGAIAAAAAHARPQATGRVFSVLALVLVMFAPALPFVIEILVGLVARQPPGWLMPIISWQDIVAQDVPRLLTGHGLETIGHGMATGDLPPYTPRSVLFQVWYELGLVGAFALAFCLARGLLLAARTSGRIAPFLMGELVTATTLAVFSQNFEQIWWACLLGTTAICFTGVINAQYRTGRPAARLVIAPRPQRPAV